MGRLSGRRVWLRRYFLRVMFFLFAFSSAASVQLWLLVWSLLFDGFLLCNLYRDDVVVVVLVLAFCLCGAVLEAVARGAEHVSAMSVS